MNLKHTKTDRNEPRLRAVVQEVGIVGYGVYWYLVEEMYEGRKLEYEDAVINTLSFLFKMQPEGLRGVIDCLLKYGALVNAGELRTPDFHAIKEKYRKAGSNGASKRWSDKPAPVAPEPEPPKKKEEPKEEAPIAEAKKPEEDRLGELLKKALQKTGAVKEAPVEKPKPVRRQTPKVEPTEEVTEGDLAALEQMSEEVPKPIKETEFLPLFNDIKKYYTPTSTGHKKLSKTEVNNLKELIKAGYTLQDFQRVIHEAMRSKYIQENGLDIPDHVLRSINFSRYLSKSEKVLTPSTNFTNNR